jgi:hypothetical protein
MSVPPEEIRDGSVGGSVDPDQAPVWEAEMQPPYRQG